VILLNDYSSYKINRDTIIKGKCVTLNCDNFFNRVFRYLFRSSNFCCDICTKNISKIKSKNTFISKYGVENPMLLDETKNKIKKTLLSKYGVTHQMLLSDTKDKIKNTLLSKYNVDHQLKSEQIKNNIKKTCLDKYGVEYIFQSKEFKEKSKCTSLKKYNVEYPCQSKEFKEKCKKTNLNNYGIEYPSQRKEIKDKKIKTSIRKYGVEHPLQNSEIMNKSSKNLYKVKDFILPSGNTVKCQGYEPFALNELFNNLNLKEEEVKTGSKNVPVIWYNDTTNKKHRHYVDIFIPSQNKCIEVKSTWTIQKQKENIFLKQSSAKNLGFLYEIWVYNAKGERVECII
jgi:hypothetical protein